MTETAVRDQLALEIAHWRQAADALADLEVVASADAWAGLESYTRLRLRDRLLAVVGTLRGEASDLHAALAAEGDPAELRRRLLRLRERYVQAETLIDFFADAVNSRTSTRLSALLRGLDTVAADSMDNVLRPLGIQPPPILVYLDKGMGAAIMRAGIGLFNNSHPSPVAAIKLTRHNLGHPTALFHETGHQVGHATGWSAELADSLWNLLVRRSRELAEVWRSWAGEVVGDVHAFALAGWAPVPALAHVVDGTSTAVYRMPPGDPHPFPVIRVLLNTALCQGWFGRNGPWTTLARTWCERHPPTGSDGAHWIARASIGALGDIVEACTRRPMEAFGGRPLCALANPLLASPKALAELAERAGPSLLTSQYLARRESVRILAALVTRAVLDPSAAAACRRRLQDWLVALGAGQSARSAWVASGERRDHG
ncbi:hypothetical protein [Streptomyces sp. SAJ15]|uniref:hypothetical protein n=1 Tax=Streptomyces sp. SAJ15 TaxID=2011095 RepID=UPI001186770D|nr:hypothetical protein [Streptomyces sp. SAJ15]TVL91248.1 hypothetical protein CD790_18535 [Streptomyces sp. SAJ15]